MESFVSVSMIFCLMRVAWIYEQVQGLPETKSLSCVTLQADFVGEGQ